MYFDRIELLSTYYIPSSILTSKKKILSLTFGQAAAAATQSGVAQ